jgi:hypothetical protein
MNKPNNSPQPRLPWSAKALLVGVLLLNLFCLTLLVYRFTLPTDGWLVSEPDGYEDNGFIYQINVLGRHLICKWRIG